jgi:hypothetical protein
MAQTSHSVVGAKDRVAATMVASFSLACSLLRLLVPVALLVETPESRNFAFSFSVLSLLLALYSC